MASLSSLVHELRERIASSSSTLPNKGDDVALETRFRAVLPNLLNAYVIASPSANEREVIAVLKLLNHTAKNFPGVFYHGKSNAVLPLIGRILPFFAEPSFRARHGVILEAVGSLLSLLRSGDRDAYRRFFVDAMLVIEDLVYVAPMYSSNAETNIVVSAKVSLRCFAESFAEISDGRPLLSDLPEQNKPGDGYGVVVDLTAKERWKPFSTWIIRLLTKCLTEGTIYVEGLVTTPFISTTCSMLCYDDADLHMACFDFARIVGTAMNYDIVPYESLILSITAILSEAGGKFPVSRSMAFDSTIAGCLHALHSMCPADIIKSTAAELISVFFKILPETKSHELQGALCSIYLRISRTCPPHVWKPASLISMICSSNICFMLQDCFEVALAILGPYHIGGGASGDLSPGHSAACDKGSEQSRAGCKRSSRELVPPMIKRQKADREEVVSDLDGLGAHSSNQLFSETNEKYASDLRMSLFEFVDLLKPPNVDAKSAGEEVALATLSILCMVFSKYPNTNLSLSIFQKILLWIPWICKQANQANSIRFDLASYLEALLSILLLSGPFRGEVKSFWSDNEMEDLMYSMLKLPWTHFLEVIKTHQPWRTKCLSIQVLSKIGLKSESQFAILDLALCDEVEEVRMEAVISLPLLVLSSGFCALSPVFTWLE